MTPAPYDYYLVENAYVARFDPKTGVAEQLLPDGTWARSARTHEIFNGRPLADERDALETAAFLLARDAERSLKRGR